MKKYLLIAAALALSGCASLSSKEIATSVRLENPPHYPQTVTLKVESFTEAAGLSRNIETQPVRDAIESVLVEQRIFSEVTTDGDYTLAVAMRRVDQRLSGMTARFNAIVDWSLTPRGSTQKTWQERVATEGSAGLSDAMGGDKRYHLALAWTFSRNIEEAMKRLEASGVLSRP